MGLAVAAAYVFTAATDLNFQRHAAGIFGAALGGALILWGVEELLQGRIRGKRAAVVRTDAPLLFFSLLVATRFFPGVTMLLAGLWYGLTSV